MPTTPAPTMKIMATTSPARAHDPALDPAPTTTTTTALITTTTVVPDLVRVLDPDRVQVQTTKMTDGPVLALPQVHHVKTTMMITTTTTTTTTVNRKLAINPT